MSDETSKQAAAVADRPSLWQNIWSRIVRPNPSGVSCDYCGWTGTPDEVVKTPRLNEDGAVYQIQSCPECQRNGGLVFYD